MHDVFLVQIGQSLEHGKRRGDYLVYPVGQVIEVVHDMVVERYASYVFAHDEERAFDRMVFAVAEHLDEVVVAVLQASFLSGPSAHGGDGCVFGLDQLYRHKVMVVVEVSAKEYRAHGSASERARGYVIPVDVAPYRKIYPIALLDYWGHGVEMRLFYLLKAYCSFVDKLHVAVFAGLVDALVIEVSGLVEVAHNHASGAAFAGVVGLSHLK